MKNLNITFKFFKLSIVLCPSLCFEIHCTKRGDIAEEYIQKLDIIDVDLDNNPVKMILQTKLIIPMSLTFNDPRFLRRLYSFTSLLEYELK